MNKEIKISILDKGLNGVTINKVFWLKKNLFSLLPIFLRVLLVFVYGIIIVKSLNISI